MSIEVPEETQYHQIYDIQEVDLEESEKGVVFYYKLIFLCGVVEPLTWRYTMEDLEEMDRNDTSYDPFTKGQWVEMTSEGRITLVPSDRMKGGRT